MQNLQALHRPAHIGGMTMVTRPPKIHYAPRPIRHPWTSYTRCGKWIPHRYVTTDASKVTCRTCRLILDLDPDWEPNDE